MHKNETQADNGAPASVKATFSLPVGGGFLNATANLPMSGTNLTQMLPLIQNLENAIVERVSEEATQAGSPISCKAGCGACCRQLVPVSLFEAEALSEWVARLPEEKRTALEERFHRALTALRDAGVIGKILDERWRTDEELTTQLAVDYFRAHVPCPFLENESCSIHPIRPLSCREYLVTSPPALCEDPMANPVAGVRLPLKLSRVLYSFGQEIEEQQRGWIPLVFLPAWATKGGRPGEAVAGSGEEVLRRVLERVASMAQADQNRDAGDRDTGMQAGTML